MPQDVKLRKMWFTSARCANEPGKSNYYCCEDHFDLKNCMDNYVRYSLVGAPRKLKRTSTKPTKEEVLNSKRIASLRIHVERVIRRV